MLVLLIGVTLVTFRPRSFNGFSFRHDDEGCFDSRVPAEPQIGRAMRSRHEFVLWAGCNSEAETDRKMLIWEFRYRAPQRCADGQLRR